MYRLYLVFRDVPREILEGDEPRVQDFSPVDSEGSSSDAAQVADVQVRRPIESRSEQRENLRAVARLLTNLSEDRLVRRLTLLQKTARHVPGGAEAEAVSQEEDLVAVVQENSGHADGERGLDKPNHPFP